MLFFSCMTHFWYIFRPLCEGSTRFSGTFCKKIGQAERERKKNREKEDSFFLSFLSFLSLAKCLSIYKSEEDIAQSEHIRSGDPIENITLRKGNCNTRKNFGFGNKTGT